MGVDWLQSILKHDGRFPVFVDIEQIVFCSRNKGDVNDFLGWNSQVNRCSLFSS